MLKELKDKQDIDEKFGAKINSSLEEFKAKFAKGA